MLENSGEEVDDGVYEIYVELLSDSTIQTDPYVLGF
jgi:hypothetical protein